MEGEICSDWILISHLALSLILLKNYICIYIFAELNIQHASLEKSENLQRHKTEGFSSSKALVVRRGAPFRVSLQLEGRPFNPECDALRVKLTLGTHRPPPHSLFCELAEFPFASLSFLLSGPRCLVMPVTFSKKASSTCWQAYFKPEGLDLRRPSILIFCPASASVGCYGFQLCVSTQGKTGRCLTGQMVLLCNPWCPGKR